MASSRGSEERSSLHPLHGQSPCFSQCTHSHVPNPSGRRGGSGSSEVASLHVSSGVRCQRLSQYLPHPQACGSSLPLVSFFQTLLLPLLLPIYLSPRGAASSPWPCSQQAECRQDHLSPLFRIRRDPPQTPAPVRDLSLDQSLLLRGEGLGLLVTCCLLAMDSALEFS